MKLRKIAALVGGSALAISLIGAGVGATFTKTASAADNITVGKMDIYAAAGNDASFTNPNSVCTYLVTASSGTQVCYVKVWEVGDIVPSNLQMQATVTGSFVLTEPAKWSVSDNVLNASGVLNNAAPPTWNYANPTVPYTFAFTVKWSNLDTISLGDHFTLTFTATATA